LTEILGLLNWNNNMHNRNLAIVVLLLNVLSRRLVRFIG